MPAADSVQSLGNTLAILLGIACLLPLLGFLIEIFAGYWSDRLSKTPALIAVGCIGGGFVCSVLAMVLWGNATGWAALKADDHGAAHHSVRDLAAESQMTLAQAEEHGEEQPVGADRAEMERHAAAAAGATLKAHSATGDEKHEETATGKIPAHAVFSGTIYRLAKFGELDITVDYYIDSLTLVMFVMVTLIATCIHIFAIGYMSGELTHEYVDHAVHLPDGRHLHRPGRHYLFFAYMSLFCFSMLGLVYSGSIFLVFVFWELVGICSYLLIGFYVERKSANVAANKAFIMNRVGDFGFLIGLMILWTSFGTFRFAENIDEHGHAQGGLFHMLRGDDGLMMVSSGTDEVILHEEHGEPLVDENEEPRTIPYSLLVIAGLGIFAGCVGKSAQFPLQTWLPDAMEGPTPVSALVHSATMVAAGVYLAGRFFPMFTTEVLLVIAYTGCITLFIAATIAIVATDIKRVLAYSTISQLGYMMLAIGVGGWGAGLFHLITHAFFKSLMFLASGSVIFGCHHEQEMPKMGGLWRKMPITALTMLVGVIAIAGLALPLPIMGARIAFSGYHSKDAIVATALAFTEANSMHFLLFLAPLVTAGITAFYMFRLWFYTFAGDPRDKHVYDHAHESPKVMTVPLLVLSLLAAGCAIGGESGVLYQLLINSEPIGVAGGRMAAASGINLPSHEAIHLVHAHAGTWALIVAVLGAFTAYAFYGARWVNPAEVGQSFPGLYRFLVEKWQFDALYDAMFVRPVRIIAGWFVIVDRVVLDGFLHAAAGSVIHLSKWDRRFDESIIDGFANLLGDVTFGIGRSFRRVQTGMLRQYITFIALGVLALFVLMLSFFPV
ncbi:MAG: NADH-quinone oxidoreductase subunit L [Planctomycetaceae bacterium]